MSKIVFVLGAGASAHCGTPLMGNFLEVAEDLLRAGEVKEAAEDFKNVFDAVGNLHAIQSKAKINTYNVEDVFAAFEMGKLLGRLPGIEEDNQIDELISSIKKVIGYTLEKTTKLPRSGEINAPESYYEFAGIIGSLIEEGKSCSIITFNYDLGLDLSLYARRILPDYSLGDIDPTNKKSVSLLKLHGSLNFGWCTECKKATPCRGLLWPPNVEVRTNYSIIPVMSKLPRQDCSLCKKQVEEDPFIVPPTWNKTAYHEQIEPVWKRAAHELKDAENIIVLGYSFPSTDMFFRYLFALGVEMSTILRGFYVYDIDPTVEERFQSLLGSSIIQRFHYYEVPFETAISQVYSSEYLNIRQILGIS